MKILDDNYRWVNTEEACQALQTSCNVYLLTRFNLKFWKTAKSGMDTRSAEWMEKRFGLFETYCVPSVNNQTYQNFLWLCLFADDTPKEWLRRLVEIKKKCKAFYPLLLDDNEGQEHERATARFIDRLHPQGQTVITLRIDNDDAISCDFMAKAVSMANTQVEQKVIYWFESGIQYYHKEKVAFQMKSPHNHYPFLVVKESFHDDMTILAFSHRGNLPDGYVKRILPSEAMWMEVIHDDNVMNEVELNLMQHPYTDERTFQERFVNMPLNTRLYHYFTFLLPRMSRHLMRRLYQKVKERR